MNLHQYSQMKRRLCVVIDSGLTQIQERGLENLHQGVQRLQQLAEMNQKTDRTNEAEETHALTEISYTMDADTGMVEVPTLNKTLTRAITKVFLFIFPFGNHL